MPLAEMFASLILNFWRLRLLSEDIPWLFVPWTQERCDWCLPKRSSEARTLPKFGSRRGTSWRSKAFSSKHHFTADATQKDEEKLLNDPNGPALHGF